MELCDAYSFIEAYKFLEKRCDAIDEFVQKTATDFAPNPSEYCTQDVANRIIELTNRKKKLINLKIFVDECVRKLPLNEQKILQFKMNYSCNMNKISAILNISERTAFRHLKRAICDFLEAASSHYYCDRALDLFKNEKWISNIRDDYIAKNKNVTNETTQIQLN